MTKNRICRWCKKEITDIKNNNQKYHLKPQPGHDKSCSEYARLEKKVQIYNKRYNNAHIIVIDDELGSRGTGLKKPLPSDRIGAYKLIKSEFKRLGLQRRGFGVTSKKS